MCYHLIDNCKFCYLPFVAGTKKLNPCGTVTAGAVNPREKLVNHSFHVKYLHNQIYA